jgi:hypothetical protein
MGVLVFLTYHSSEWSTSLWSTIPLISRDDAVHIGALILFYLDHVDLETGCPVELT